jgi:hypothetical protein
VVSRGVVMVRTGGSGSRSGTLLGARWPKDRRLGSAVAAASPPNDLRTGRERTRNEAAKNGYARCLGGGGGEFELPL